MPKPEQTPQQKIAQAIIELSKAYTENFEASKAETDAKLRKTQAYHKLLSAKQYLYSTESEILREM